MKVWGSRTLRLIDTHCTDISDDISLSLSFQKMFAKFTIEREFSIKIFAENIHTQIHNFSKSMIDIGYYSSACLIKNYKLPGTLLSLDHCNLELI